MKKGYSVETFNGFGINNSLLVENCNYSNYVINYRLGIKESYNHKDTENVIGVWKIKKLN